MYLGLGIALIESVNTAAAKPCRGGGALEGRGACLWAQSSFASLAYKRRRR